MACTIDHSGNVPRSVGSLESSQAGFWRHKCADCAYLQGRADAGAAEQKLREQVRGLRERLATVEAELQSTRTAQKDR